MKVIIADTPWTQIGDEFRPELLTDPALPAGWFRSWVDVTGSGQGENWAKASPEAAQGAPSGDPDYLTVQVHVADESALPLIEADNRYHIYWDGDDTQTYVFWAAPYDYSSGNGPTAPGPGAIYFRTNTERLRIGRSDARADTLKAGDRIAVAEEEFFELRGERLAITADYVEWDAADLQRGPDSITLADGSYQFEFLVGAERKRRDKHPPAVEWNALLTTLENRNYPAGWIDNNFGRERKRWRKTHDDIMRLGYLTAQV